MQRGFAIWLSILLLAVPFAANAQSFTINVDGVVSIPVGGDTGIRNASDELDAGLGARVAALYDVAAWLSAGIGIGIVANRTDLIPASFIPGGSTTNRVSGILTSVPIHAVLHTHTTGEADLGFFGEAGIGITDFTLRANDIAQSGDLSQSDFSFVVGAGATYLINETLAARIGIHYRQAFTGTGDVWLEGENPQAVLFSLGVRFRRGEDDETR